MHKILIFIPRFALYANNYRYVRKTRFCVFKRVQEIKRHEEILQIEILILQILRLLHLMENMNKVPRKL